MGSLIDRTLLLTGFREPLVRVSLTMSRVPGGGTARCPFPKYKNPDADEHLAFPVLAVSFARICVKGGSYTRSPMSSCLLFVLSGSRSPLGSEQQSWVSARLTLGSICTPSGPAWTCLGLSSLRGCGLKGCLRL